MADAEDLDLETTLDFGECFEREVLLTFEDFGDILLAAAHEFGEAFLGNTQFLHLVEHHHGDMLRVAEPRLVGYAPLGILAPL